VADQLVEALSGGVPEAIAMARYQATRDLLSRRLIAATEAVAGYDWDTEGVQALVRQVSSAMSDEVEFLQARDRRLGPEPSGLRRPDGVPIRS
jgi:hypothetical protein